MAYTIGGCLYHHGILGMKWGQRNGPPYPLGSSKHSASEQKAGWRKSLSSKTNSNVKNKTTKSRVETNKSSTKKTVSNNQNQKKVETKEEYEARKQKALKSGTAADVLKFKGDLTNQQLQEALNRINLEKQLGSLNAKDVKTAADKVDTIINKIDKARDWTEKGVRAYNTAAKIINAFNDDADLPIIGAEKKTKNQREMDKKLADLELENKKLKNESQKIINNNMKQYGYIPNINQNTSDGNSNKKKKKK